MRLKVWIRLSFRVAVRLRAQSASRTCTNGGVAAPCPGVFNSLDSLTERRLFNIAHVSERERPLRVMSGKARLEHLLSAFPLKADMCVDVV
jgi:hypothetical protein